GHVVDHVLHRCEAAATLFHWRRLHYVFFFFFFFTDTATTEIYTLSLHDALPISWNPAAKPCPRTPAPRSSLRRGRASAPSRDARDRKSTRLNSSHRTISYAVFCLKKKKHKSEIPALALYHVLDYPQHCLDKFVRL